MDHVHNSFAFIEQWLNKRMQTVQGISRYTPFDLPETVAQRIFLPPISLKQFSLLVCMRAAHLAERYQTTKTRYHIYRLPVIILMETDTSFKRVIYKIHNQILIHVSVVLRYILYLYVLI